jgi:ribosome-interacting GTPase 1
MKFKYLSGVPSVVYSTSKNMLLIKLDPFEENKHSSLLCQSLNDEGIQVAQNRPTVNVIKLFFFFTDEVAK